MTTELEINNRQTQQTPRTALNSQAFVGVSFC